MAVNLVKGQKIDLTKGNAGLDELMIGLGWDPVKKSAGGLLSSLFGGIEKNVDCDASVLMLDKNEHLATQKDIIYFGNLTHSSKSVCHMGDNLTGDGDNDDEQIFIKLSKIPGQIQKLVFVVNIYDCMNRKQDFGMIKQAYIRVVDNRSKVELVRFSLTDDYKGSTALIVGEVYRHEGEWKFSAVGNGTKDASLKTLINRYQ